MLFSISRHSFRSIDNAYRLLHSDHHAQTTESVKESRAPIMEDMKLKNVILASPQPFIALEKRQVVQKRDLHPHHEYPVIQNTSKYGLRG